MTCDRGWCAPDALCWRCMVAARNAEARARLEAERAAERAAETARLAVQRDWFTRTGHCGCGPDPVEPTGTARMIGALRKALP